MEITTHDLWTVVHGMGFGTLFMLAFSGAIGEFYHLSNGGASFQQSQRDRTMLNLYLIAMVVIAWLTVFSGEYIVYPWYRAVPPAGTTDLSEYPRRLLLSSPRTSEWHNVGMEWKEHVAWLAPIAMTMVADVTMKYGAPSCDRAACGRRCWPSSWPPSSPRESRAPSARSSTSMRRSAAARRSS